MSRIEDLAEKYRRHIATPWQRTVAGAQRVIMVIYAKELERTLRARKLAFETATKQADHEWHEIDLAPVFAEWMAQNDYRDEYFASPKDLELTLTAEFPNYVAGRLRTCLDHPNVTEKSVVAVFGAGSIFGLARISQIIAMIEPNIRGRLVMFYPGHRDGNNYRLLDARDGWNYLAVSIALHGEGEEL